MSSAAGSALAKLLRVNFVNFTGSVRCDAVGHRPWASVTFSGGRHRLRLEVEGEGAVGAAADFLERLPELDLPLPGAIVADLALVCEARHDNGRYAALDLEALTVDDD